MTHSSPRHTIDALLQECKRDRQQAEHRSRSISISRLILFLAAILMSVLFLNTNAILWIISASICMILFFAFIGLHSRLFRELSLLRCREKVLQNELDCLNLNPNTYYNGENFRNNMRHADDLDLFGRKSLFHLINRCSTKGGQQRLSELLIEPPLDNDTILNRQEAVRELSELLDFRIKAMTLLMTTEENNEIRQKTTSQGERKHLALLIGAYVTTMILSIALYAFTGNYLLFIITSITGMMTSFYSNRKSTEIHKELDGLKNTYAIYSLVMKDFASLDMRASLLKKMQDKGRSSIEAFNNLSKIAESFDRRHNIAWLLLSNILFLNDIILQQRYHRWMTAHNTELQTWCDILTELEILLSISGFAYGNPSYCFPILSDTMKIDAKELRHPLIPHNVCVANDINISDSPRFMLITGSNMSGKSTWLRTVGVNMVLAQIGAPVAANYFSWSPMIILTSLRQSDSLAENTSLFMNELKQLQRILKTVEDKHRALILLDEILRGTNSDDKFAGSQALALKLGKINCITIMATHDLKLSELESQQPEVYKNYCFESSSDGGSLTFDYKMREGVAVNRNATWLMREMNII